MASHETKPVNQEQLATVLPYGDPGMPAIDLDHMPWSGVDLEPGQVCYGGLGFVSTGIKKAAAAAIDLIPYGSPARRTLNAAANNRAGRTVGGLMAFALTGTVLGLGYDAMGLVKSRDVYDVTAQPAKYEGSFLYDQPVECWGGYHDAVDVTATYDAKKDINTYFFGTKTLDLYYKFTLEQTGDKTVIVCSKKQAVDVVWNKDHTEATATYPQDAFVSYVFDTNPLQVKYTTGEGITAAAAGAIEDIVKGLNDIPYVNAATKHINVSGSDEIKSILSGLATVEAGYQSSEGCKDKAWHDLADTNNPADPDGSQSPLAQQIDKDIAREHGIATDKVHTKLPRQISLPNQYQSIVDGLKASADYKGGILQLSFPTNPSCGGPSDTHNKVISLAPDSLTPSLSDGMGQ